MITETQNHTPGDWHLVKDRLVTQPDPPNGPYIRLALFLPLASQADKDLIVRAPALLTENTRLLKEAEAADGIFCAASGAVNELKAENARLREALKRAAQSLVHDSLMLRRAAAQSARSALAGERGEK